MNYQKKNLTQKYLMLLIQMILGMRKYYHERAFRVVSNNFDWNHKIRLRMGEG